MLSRTHNGLADGKGWVDAAWVVSRCDFFFPPLVAVFFFISAVLYYSAAGCLAKPDSRTHRALSSPNGSRQLLQPVAKTPGPSLIARAGLFICPACLASHFSHVCYAPLPGPPPPSCFDSPPAP